MDYSNTTKRRVYRYLADHGPSSSLELERALNLSQSAISLLLRGEADLIKGERTPSMIYAKSLRGKAPRTIIACITRNTLAAIELDKEIRAVDQDDAEAVEAVARQYIKRALKMTELVEQYLREGTDTSEDD